MTASRRCVALLMIAATSQLVVGLVIESAERQINLSMQRVGHQTKLMIKNDGEAAADAVTVCLPAALHAHAALIRVGQGTDAAAETLQASLPWARPAGAPEGIACGQYSLLSPLEPGETVQVMVMAVLTKVLHPHPARIKLGDTQRVAYEDSAHVVSPYAMLTEQTAVDLGVKGVESHTGVPPAVVSGTKLKLGPYADVAPYAAGPPLRVHFENNSPFVEGVAVEREVDVSPWGTVFFEDRCTVAHTGAKLTGEFSRFELMTNPAASRSAVAMLAAVVPPAARDIFFRDEIGNISTSNVRPGGAPNGRDTLVLLTPRFPLFGGWVSSFKFGWTVPLSTVVGRGRDGRYAAAFNLGPAIQDLPVDKLTLRVVLPEGASRPKASCYLPHEATYGRVATYLDVLGRPEVVLRVEGFVPESKAVAVVTYDYNGLALLQKPLILAAVCAVVFVLGALLSGSSSKGGALAAAAAVKPHAS